jgi:predicted phosphate transport protein (TIGR00153 family)
VGFGFAALATGHPRREEEPRRRSASFPNGPWLRGKDVMLKLFTKTEEKFFGIFNQMVVHISEAVEILLSMVSEPAGDMQAMAVRIKELEHKGDELTHRVIDELNKTFITPIDREDIHDLSIALDDVLDLIDATAARIVLFQIHESIPAAPEMSRVLLSQVKEISAAVKKLQDNDHVVERCIEINRLENDADRLFQTAIARLFNEAKDPIDVIKKKEIIETLERATDKAEDVANVLQTIIVKNA